MIYLFDGMNIHGTKPDARMLEPVGWFHRTLAEMA
jgi:hypothetical protein